nr:MAG TPA: hydrogenase/urease nickel incorporation protein [Caudoviricetes sp.]
MKDRPAHSTIGALIEDKFSLHIYCEAYNCGHHGEVDLEKLAMRIGVDHGAMHYELIPVFKCPACGSKHLSMRISPNVQQNIGPVGPLHKA